MNEFKEGKKMQDKLEVIGKGSVIQHGKLNNRIYLIKFDKADFPKIIDHINNLARKYLYTKIFCKVPHWASPVFISNGFIVEAQIPNFYNNKDAVFFMSKFLNSDRLMRIEHNKLEELAKQIISVSENELSRALKPKFRVKLLTPEQNKEIAKLYKTVFESYPFPIYEAKYILKSMKDNVQYYGIKKAGKLIALASSEVDMGGKNAEMTDFATLPDFRGNNLSSILLHKMEHAMKQQGITTLYTIARLNSIAMNRTFLRLNYNYAGTLIKNTNIAGKIESMNVYYKHIFKD